MGISFVSPLAAGNAVQLLLAPQTGALWWRLLRRVDANFSGPDDTGATVIVDNWTSQGALDFVGLVNGTTYYYQLYSTTEADGTADDDYGLVADGVATSAIPAATYQDASQDPQTVLINRLILGLAVEVSRQTIIPSATAQPPGVIPVFRAPFALQDKLSFPCVNVHLDDTSSGERFVGEMMDGDLTGIGGNVFGTEGWLAPFNLNIVGVTLNPDERIALRQALRRIIQANLAIFDSVGMFNISFSQTDSEQFSENAAPLYLTAGRFACTAPVSITDGGNTPLNDISFTVSVGDDAFDAGQSQPYVMEPSVMKNYVYFTNKNNNATSTFTTAMATDDLSAVSGVTFVVYPDDAETSATSGTFPTIDTVLAAVPARFVLKIGMPASALSATKTYPFKTVNVAYGTTMMVVPVISDPAFVTWMVARWMDVYNYLNSKGAASRLVCLGIGPTGAFPGDGQFHIPGDTTKTPAENTEFWADLGVDHTTVPSILAGYMQTLKGQPQFANVNFVMAYLDPYDDYIGSRGQGDGGKSYTAIQQAMQAQEPQSYVLIDQSLMDGPERGIVRAAATGHPFACQLSPEHNSDATIDAYKQALGFDPQWVEWQVGDIAVLTAWIAAHPYGF